MRQLYVTEQRVLFGVVFLLLTDAPPLCLKSNEEPASVEDSIDAAEEPSIPMCSLENPLGTLLIAFEDDTVNDERLFPAVLDAFFFFTFLRFARFASKAARSFTSAHPMSGLASFKSRMCL